MTKQQIRKAYQEKTGDKLKAGKMQLSYHGAGNKSIQIFKKKKLIQDVNFNY